MKFDHVCYNYSISGIPFIIREEGVEKKHRSHERCVTAISHRAALFTNSLAARTGVLSQADAAYPIKGHLNKGVAYIEIVVPAVE